MVNTARTEICHRRLARHRCSNCEGFSRPRLQCRCDFAQVERPSVVPKTDPDGRRYRGCHYHHKSGGKQQRVRRLRPTCYRRNTFSLHRHPIVASSPQHMSRTLGPLRGDLNRQQQRIAMRKISMLATALILIGIGAWTMRTAPRVDASTADAIYPLRLMTNAKNLPEAHYVDYTFVFN